MGRRFLNGLEPVNLAYVSGTWKERKQVSLRGCLIYTLGDPHSINVEAFLRVVAGAAARWPVVVVGSKWQFDYQAAFLHLPVPELKMIANIEDARTPGLFFLDPSPTVGCKATESLSDAERGALAVAALKAIPRASAAPLAVLTAPIDKFATHRAGFTYPGQTEFFEDLWQGAAVMLLAGPKLRVGLATNHVALKQVSQVLSQKGIEQKIAILADGLRKIFGLAKPRIAVCGLNPHCSDHGLFGDEEDLMIAPAVRSAQKSMLQFEISGPLPADTIFYRAARGDFDAVLAMYHDQGLGPLKTLHFDDAVNISLGLKHLRVSPDHGPARDLYGKTGASWKSFEAARTHCERYLQSMNEPSVGQG